MVSKKGWLRVIEAGVGILIIAGVLLVVTRTNSVKIESGLSSHISAILEEIAKNQSLRKKIIDNRPGIEAELESFILDRIEKSDLTVRVRICSISSDCSLDRDTGEEKDISTAERIISTNIESTETIVFPKRVRAFSWES